MDRARVGIGWLLWHTPKVVSRYWPADVAQLPHFFTRWWDDQTAADAVEPNGTATTVRFAAVPEVQLTVRGPGHQAACVFDGA